MPAHEFTQGVITGVQRLLRPVVRQRFGSRRVRPSAYASVEASGACWRGTGVRRGGRDTGTRAAVFPLVGGVLPGLPPAAARLGGDVGSVVVGTPVSASGSRGSGGDVT